MFSFRDSLNSNSSYFRNVSLFSYKRCKLRNRLISSSILRGKLFISLFVKQKKNLRIRNFKIDSWTLLSRFDLFFFPENRFDLFPNGFDLNGFGKLWRSRIYRTPATPFIIISHCSLFFFLKDLGTGQIGCHDFLATLVWTLITTVESLFLFIIYFSLTTWNIQVNMWMVIYWQH